ncbi:hypothetical protein LTR37_011897 [Vermiconidia calcicola]|uniref:Uncharacterized protein n=1 Tax=Vermiconidia calcicola TaxID=1690605 RepID=A0ACC3N0M4_9PEZI|nr:hypothetical protein LTR37_011897 [Vermiconidia calcicola]
MNETARGRQPAYEFGLPRRPRISSRSRSPFLDSPRSPLPERCARRPIEHRSRSQLDRDSPRSPLPERWETADLEDQPTCPEAIIADDTEQPTLRESSETAYAAYASFIALLVGLVNLAREQRALAFQIRSLERDQKQLEDDHDKARLYLRYDQDGARKVDNAFASEQELNCDVKRIEECIKDNEFRLQELKGQAERNRTPFREQMTEAYHFEAPFENSSWPTQPIFSPLFWQRLRQTKAGSGLLEDDIDKVAILRSELSLSTTAISGTAPAVLQLTADLKTAEARLDTRRRNHEVLEAALLLDLAGPFLEAERLID